MYFHTIVTIVKRLIRTIIDNKFQIFCICMAYGHYRLKKPIIFIFIQLVFLILTFYTLYYR